MEAGGNAPIHDWSLVDAGTFHHLHCYWIPEIGNALNGGILPEDYYAMAEQVAGSVVPDVLALREGEPSGDPEKDGLTTGATAIAASPPRVRYTATLEMDEYARRQRALVVRHVRDDRVVALVEILSPGNKASRHAMRSFVEKAADALAQGVHLLLIDLHKPGPRDPQGIHGAVWEEIGDDSYVAPGDKPLTLVAYSAGHPKTAYIEPIAVGDLLPDMPLFLADDYYVNVPLEATYQAAWRGVPRRWRQILESKGSE